MPFARRRALSSMRVLFVCLGNICRSPTAEGVLRGLIARESFDGIARIDSAGTANYHCGAPPDLRSQRAARARGYDLSALRARQFIDRDFTDFDLILAMDRQNLADIERCAPVADRHKVQLFLAYLPGSSHLEVPDPYYGGVEGFETVLDLCEAAGLGLIAQLRDQTDSTISRRAGSSVPPTTDPKTR